MMSLRLVPPIHRATHRIGLYLADLCAHGLSQGEAHILARLATSASATIAELHRGLAHKRSTLTSILDRLAGRGFITRAVGARDRRTFVITPTTKGRRVAGQVHRHLAALEQAVSRGVTTDDVKGFLAVVSAVEEAARRLTRAAPGRRTPDRARGR
jgi:DNA-binding MarR family transcriptional regulator